MKIQPPLTPEELELFMGYFERNGPDDHAEDCPGDETCECHVRPESDAIGRASIILHHYADVVRLARLAEARGAEVKAWRQATPWGHTKACEESADGEETCEYCKACRAAGVAEARAATDAAEREGSKG